LYHSTTLPLTQFITLPLCHSTTSSLRHSITLFLLLLLPSLAWSDFTSRSVGTSGANFLKLGVSGGAAGMGEAVSASVEDPTALYWNAAGLAGLQKPAVSMMFASYLNASNFEYLGLGFPLGGERGALALDFTYLTAGAAIHTDASGNRLGSFSPYSLAVSLGYGRQWGRLRVGTAARWISSKILKSAEAFAFDLGIQVLDLSGLNLALVLKNAGTRLKFEERGDPLPTTLRLGAAYRWERGFLLGVDVEAPRDNQPLVHLGAQSRIFSESGTALWLRAGYSSLAGRVRGFSGPSFGIGFGLNRLSLDYAATPMGELGQAHRLSVGYAW
ncbi:MAG: PorV/PorQ family protein, partial [Elusimicrobia bacterium]|nr:PorV/PorQ family protein [Elusimicrobiota bacterium]